MDLMVLATQRWLNATYGSDSRYNAVDEDGYTGWETIYGLTRALQIELGITTTADNFGPTTISKFNNRFPNGIAQQENLAEYEDNIYGIIQGALWCKGYSTGASGITTHFYGGTGNAIMNLKSHMGITSTDSTVTLNVMKSLLSMDQFVLVSGGTLKIRTIQQALNAKYEPYIGIIPCDGVYGRAMNKALIYVLQAVEGQSTSQADGSFGPGTQSKLPILPDTENILTSQQVIDAAFLVRYALVCNGFTDTDIATSGWDDKLAETVGAFQASMALTVTCCANKDTWMSLLLSKGNPDRAAKACDTRFEMTAERITVLKNNGYEIVGRYINGTEFKILRDDEPARILENGLKFFPIYQDSGTEISYFTASNGAKDAIAASIAVRKFQIPEDTIVYFAVDMDPLGTQITSNIIPYFEALNASFDCRYKIGVYGTRNVCTKVCEEGLAITSFVSDMSTGFSGNMGFKMPDDWNYDQFAEISLGDDWAIDKDAYSGRYPAVSTLDMYEYTKPSKPVITDVTPLISTVYSAIEQLEDAYVSYVSDYNVVPTSCDIVLGLTNFLRSTRYYGAQWWFTTASTIDQGFITHLQTNCKELYDFFTPLMPPAEQSDPPLFTDGIGGQIELPHLAATLECYTAAQPVADFWTGWGADLATGMEHTKLFLESEYGQGYSIQAAADKTIGLADKDELGKSYCNFSDFCMDADAIKLAELIKAMSDEELHPLSSALRTYYSGLHQNRFNYLLEDIGSNYLVGNLKTKIYEKMNGIDESIGLLPLKAGGASAEVVEACCNSFAYYIHTELA